MSNAWNQPLVAVAEAKDASDAISVIQLHHDSPDDIVQAGTEPSAGNDCRGRFRGIKIDLLARSGHFEIERTQSALEYVTDALHRIVMDYPVFISSKDLLIQTVDAAKAIRIGSALVIQ